MAKPLKEAGLDSINISLDSLDTHLFELVTNGGNLSQVLAGIDAAVEQGISIKINVVALKGVNDLALDDFVRFAAEKKCDITFIEVMPMGDIGNETRVAQYLPLDEVKKHLNQNWQLTPSTYKSGGPARYYDCAETGQRIGFITPLSQNFCSQCNRVRLSATGKLYSCLGQENEYDLLTVLRAQGEQGVRDMIHQAILKSLKVMILKFGRIMLPKPTAL